MRQNLLVNLSQSHGRKPWGIHTSALTQNTILYSFDEDYCLSGLQNLRLQGLPSSMKIAGIPDEGLRSLAGEGFCLPCFDSALFAMFLTPGGPWWHGRT